jgi:dTDP-4-dehydrorhamnose reductase
MIAGLTGAGGMLGREIICEAKARGIELISWNRRQMDVTDANATARTIGISRVDVVIHAAAWTDVDGCESDPERAQEVNGRGTANVARTCAELGAALVYVSSDYVFSGEKETPYVEDDPPSPINEYGESKRAGEEAVRACGERSVVARTSWVYADHGKNFLQTMLRRAQAGDPLRVVDDQMGSPTFAADLAVALLDLANAAVLGRAQGNYHVTNGGATTWHGFACKIFELAHLRADVAAVSSNEFPRPARRPKNSVLADTRLADAGVAALPHWEDALARCVMRISAGAENPQSRRETYS